MCYGPGISKRQTLPRNPYSSFLSPASCGSVSSTFDTQPLATDIALSSSTCAASVSEDPLLLLFKDPEEEGSAAAEENEDFDLNLMAMANNSSLSPEPATLSTANTTMLLNQCESLLLSSMPTENCRKRPCEALKEEPLPAASFTVSARPPANMPATSRRNSFSSHTSSTTSVTTPMMLTPALTSSSASSSNHSTTSEEHNYKANTAIPPPDSEEYKQLSKADIKRMKNTEAARQSRRRKLEHLQQLEDKIQWLQSDNQRLESDNERLSGENRVLVGRVSALERQVEELHAVLVAFGREKNQQREL